MMQTLKACYQEIASDEQRWSYYQNPSCCIQNRWEDEGVAYDFIELYFELGGKSEVFRDSQLKKNKGFIEERAPHIISTYLLGIKIAECFGIDTRTRGDNKLNFLYYWFLTCLYHDVGYAYESEHCCEKLMTTRAYGIDGLELICDLKNVDNSGIFRTFPRELVDYYLKCRADCRKSKPVIDHGIVGGLLLYDKLCKQFRRAFNKRTNPDDSKDDFHIVHGDRQLHLSNRDFKEYAKAADAIIAHNIWKNTLQEYIEQAEDPQRLKSRLPKGNITLENDLSFILSLTDTLEPLKRAKDGDCSSLEKISIDSLNGRKGFVLRIDGDKEIYNAIYERAKSLKEWLCVSVQPKHSSFSKREITVTISENGSTGGGNN